MTSVLMRRLCEDRGRDLSHVLNHGTARLALNPQNLGGAAIRFPLWSFQREHGPADSLN